MAPMIPELAPEKMLIGRFCNDVDAASWEWEKERVRRSEFEWVRMGS